MSNNNNLPIYPKLEIVDDNYLSKIITTYVPIENKGTWLIKYVKNLPIAVTNNNISNTFTIDKVVSFLQEYINDIEELKVTWKKDNDYQLPNKFKNLEYMEDNITQRIFNPYYDLECTEKVCETVRALKNGIASGDIVLDVKTHVILEDIKANKELLKPVDIKWENTLKNE